MDGPYTEGEVNSRGDYVPTSDEVTAYQAARIPWASQVKYGYYTLAFLSSILVAFTIVRALWYLRTRYGYGSRSRLYTLAAASFRVLTYPRFRPHNLLDWVWTFGPLGPNLLLIAGLLFASCFTWINQYYYFAPFYGSAPLYLRSEWIAMATLPFLFVLGSKRNLISILTGVSHEKLQVLHQGAAFVFVYMSLVHTIAAVIRMYREYGYLALEYNDTYVSGFVALGPLLVLFVGALPPFRRRFYEAFYWVHIIMAIFFVGAMFWHGYQTLDSDAYMITTIVLFLASAAYRLAIFAFNNPILHVATTTILSHDVVKLSIPTTAIRWQPGQHIFLRFLGLRPFESHPFSFATMPKDHSAQVRTMEFIVRPQSGFTRALFDHVRKTGQKEFAVLIDGPYGGVGSDLRAFHSVLICAGGSGITWAMSCLQDTIQGPRSAKQAIKLVWAVPNPDDLTWFEQELLAIVGTRSDVQIQLYVTRESAPSGTINIESEGTNSTGSDEEHGPYENKEGHTAITTTLCRPDLRSIITDAVASTQGSLVVATCGPPSFLADCANTVTAAQISLIKGDYPEVSEVYLKSEAYGW